MAVVRLYRLDARLTKSLRKDPFSRPFSSKSGEDTGSTVTFAGVGPQVQNLADATIVCLLFIRTYLNELVAIFGEKLRERFTKEALHLVVFVVNPGVLCNGASGTVTLLIAILLGLLQLKAPNPEVALAGILSINGDVVAVSNIYDICEEDDRPLHSHILVTHMRGLTGMFLFGFWFSYVSGPY